MGTRSVWPVQNSADLKRALTATGFKSQRGHGEVLLCEEGNLRNISLFFLRDAPPARRLLERALGLSSWITARLVAAARLQDFNV
jgi:hypothetical protein